MKDFSKSDLKWLERLQKCLDAQPEKLIGFCTGTEIQFYKADELPTNDYGSADTFADHECVISKNWEAGAY